VNQLTLDLRTLYLANDDQGRNIWLIRHTPQTVDCERVGLIICDVWDHHWCRGAEIRLAEMLPRMQALICALRDHGGTIIHAPSDTMAHYADHPARRRVLALPTVEPPPDLAHDDPPLPVDASDEGCDTPGDETAYVWIQQHPDIAIDPQRDFVTDVGREVYNIVQARQIEQLLIMGVHTNMCVLHRSFAIKQMVRWGQPIALVRDLTDTMYNPARAPYVSHSTGTRLVVQYIEAHWCPTIHSRQILGE